MKTHALAARNADHLKTELAHFLQDGFYPTLAMVFCSVEKDLSGIRSLFSEAGIALFGCTSSGEIFNDQILGSSIVSLLFELDPGLFQLSLSADAAKNTYQQACEIGELAKSTFDQPAVIIASGGVSVNGDDIIDGLKDTLPPGVPIFGGLAGDDLNIKETFVFNTEEQSSAGLIALIVDNEKIKVDGLAFSGWEAIGATHTITRAEGNVVYTINDEPALDVFVKYFGYFDNADLQGKPISTISAQYPMQIIREDGTRVLRSPLIGDENKKSLILAGGVKEGERFRFSISPGFEVIDQTVKEFGAFHKNTPQADALILFSCVGRHAALGPMIEDEVKGIFNYWRVPMIGFFCYGEIGSSQHGVIHFHSETCSLVVMKEA